jgi:putative tricarboxylic transport membrane protein
MRQSAFDLVLLWAIGLVGVLMRRFDFPTAPVVVGMILGPLAEAQLRNAMSIGEGSFAVSVRGPDVDRVVVIIVAVLVLPRIYKRMRREAAAGSLRAEGERVAAAP